MLRKMEYCGPINETPVKSHKKSSSNSTDESADEWG